MTMYSNTFKMLLLLGISTFFTSCFNYIDKPLPILTQNVAMHLAVGNEFNYDWSSMHLTDYDIYSGFNSMSIWRITSDTVFAGKKYFIFNDTNFFLRSDSSTIYIYQNGKEEVYFTFNVDVGDSIFFRNSIYEVSDKDTAIVFNHSRLVVRCINNDKKNELINLSSI